MENARLRGAVVRAWRVSAGISSKELAERLGKTRPWVSMMESGTRGARTDPAASGILGIAKALDLTSLQAVAMVDMVEAVPTTRMIAPRKSWSHNFTGPPSPGWIWIRLQESVAASSRHEVVGSAWWGEPLQGSFSVECAPRGLLIRLATTVPNPPLEVTLNAVGWVDFGRGDVPEEVLIGCGLTGVDGRQLLRLARPLDPQLNDRDLGVGGRTLRVAQDAVRHIGLRWQIFAPHLGLLRPRVLPHALDGTTLASSSSIPPLMEDPPQQAPHRPGDVGASQHVWFTGEEMRDLREARGLTRKQVAAVATFYLGETITPKDIERVEETGRIRPPELLALLDRLYRLDGRLGVQTTYQSKHGEHRHGKHLVHFPTFYVGPVWIQATDPINPTATAVVELVWTPWRRRQHVQSGVLMTTRKAYRGDQPLDVHAPERWEVRCGVGVAPTATDINHGWYPVTFREVLVLLRHSAEALLAARRGDGAPDTHVDFEQWPSESLIDESDNEG